MKWNELEIENWEKLLIISEEKNVIRSHTCSERELYRFHFAIIYSIQYFTISLKKKMEILEEYVFIILSSAICLSSLAIIWFSFRFSLFVIISRLLFQILVFNFPFFASIFSIITNLFIIIIKCKKKKICTQYICKYIFIRGKKYTQYQFLLLTIHIYVYYFIII